MYAAIVAGTYERSLFIENGGADGDAALGESFAGFGDGDGEHGVVVERVAHWRDYTRVGWEGRFHGIVVADAPR